MQQPGRDGNDVELTDVRRITSTTVTGLANGAGDATILARHLLPNMAGTLLVQATVWIPQAIIGEAVLAFLGLGVQPPTPSWGSMLSAAQPFIALNAWIAIFPGLAIFTVVLAFNFLGDSLRDSTGPAPS